MKWFPYLLLLSIIEYGKLRKTILSKYLNGSFYAYIDFFLHSIFNWRDMIHMMLYDVYKNWMDEILAPFVSVRFQFSNVATSIEFIFFALIYFVHTQ